MSLQRERRLQRVADFLKRKLERRMAELAETVVAESAARDALFDLQRQIERAALERLERLAAGVTADQWGTEHDWRATLGVRERRAEASLLEAQQGVAQARERVLHARSEMHKIEALIRRLAAARKVTEARAERKTEDEIAALQSAHGARRAD
jgi:flagellar export protein FliJ